MENVFKIINLLNKDYGVEYTMLGAEDNKKLVLTKGDTVCILKVNMGLIGNAPAYAVITEYLDIFRMVFNNSLYKFVGNYFVVLDKGVF